MTMGSQTGFPATQDHHHQVSTFSALNLFRNYNQFMSPTGAFHPYLQYPVATSPSSQEYASSKERPALPLTMQSAVYSKRPRGEKKPIPDDQKDDRYYERRKRNNQAAKKSRDARKFREDQIALRATLLEHENAILRAQVLTLTEETQSLRQCILKEKTHVTPVKMIFSKIPGRQDEKINC